MYGGFPNGLHPTLWSWNQRSADANSTILNGNGVNRRVVSANNVGSVLVMCVFDGFTIQGANGNSTAGGLLVNASILSHVSNLIVRNCTFQNNMAANGGGVGVSATAGTANPMFENCTFTGNLGTVLGGGIYLTSTKAGTINATLTGCTFNNNTAFSAGTAQARAGGLVAYAFGGGATVQVQINGGSFTNNTAEQWGAGLYNYGRSGGVSQMTITGTSFSGNQANSGGALHNYCLGGTGTVMVNGATFNNNAVTFSGGAVRNYCELNGSTGNVTLMGCMFTGNQSGGLGGAVSNQALKGGVGNLTATACRFESNTAVQRGGAVCATGTTRSAAYPGTAVNTTVTNSLFFANTATQRGGAVYNEGISGAPSTMTLINNTVANNTSVAGAALYNAAPVALTASVQLTNNIFWNNTCSDTTSRPFHNIGAGAGITAANNSLQRSGFADNETGTGTFVNNGGNLDGDPLFVNLALGDLHLQSGSTCVDAGTGVALTVDFDGNARVQGTAVDMGAYETAGARPMARQLQTEVLPLTAAVYPNPTTGAFTVALDRELTGLAQVFDLQGRLVASQLLHSAHQLTFDLSGAASGVYLMRLVDGETVITRQVVLQKP
jgi:predicted outer membrane repeat protein